MVRQGLLRGLGLALQAVVRSYQLLVSPQLPPACRFVPSCSEYAAEAITRHGALRGVGLTLHRLARCHPWGGGGFDPVPEAGGPEAGGVDRLRSGSRR